MSRAEELAAWMNEGCWHKVSLGHVEAVGHELRRLAEIERQYLALKASIGEPVAWHSPDETEGVTGLVWLRENGVIFLGYYFDQPFREYRDTDGHYVGQQDAEAYWARHEDGEPCSPDGWCELLPPLYAIKDKQP